MMTKKVVLEATTDIVSVANVSKNKTYSFLDSKSEVCIIVYVEKTDQYCVLDTSTLVVERDGLPSLYSLVRYLIDQGKFEIVETDTLKQAIEYWQC